jgi:hypothetical protein
MKTTNQILSIEFLYTILAILIVRELLIQFLKIKKGKKEKSKLDENRKQNTID